MLAASFGNDAKAKAFFGGPENYTRQRMGLMDKLAAAQKELEENPPEEPEVKTGFMSKVGSFFGFEE